MELYLNNKIGSKIKELREMRGMSQKELSEKVGKDVAHISRIENNHLNTSVRTVFDILKVFGIKRLKLESK